MEEQLHYPSPPWPFLDVADVSPMLQHERGAGVKQMERTSPRKILAPPVGRLFTFLHIARLSRAAYSLRRELRSLNACGGIGVGEGQRIQGWEYSLPRCGS
jgi:hypothetical protein